MNDRIEIEVKCGIPYIKINGVEIERYYSFETVGEGNIELVLYKPRVVLNGKEQEYRDGKWCEIKQS